MVMATQLVNEDDCLYEISKCESDHKGLTLLLQEYVRLIKLNMLRVDTFLMNFYDIKRKLHQ
jgi:hypothetical protein